MRSSRPLSMIRTGALAALAAAGLATAATPAQAKKVVSNVYGWGSDMGGDLGSGAKSTKPQDTPQPLPDLGGVVQIARSFGSGFAVLDNGRLLAWGENGDGELGNGTTTNSSTAVPVPGLSGVKAVTAGLATLALLGDGTVEAWGRNTEGEVGDGTTENKLSPVPVPGLSEVAGCVRERSAQPRSAQRRLGGRMGSLLHAPWRQQHLAGPGVRDLGRCRRGSGLCLRARAPLRRRSARLGIDAVRPARRRRKGRPGQSTAARVRNRCGRPVP